MFAEIWKWWSSRIVLWSYMLSDSQLRPMPVFFHTMELGVSLRGGWQGCGPLSVMQNQVPWWSPLLFLIWNVAGVVLQTIVGEVYRITRLRGSAKWSNDSPVWLLILMGISLIQAHHSPCLLGKDA